MTQKPNYTPSKTGIVILAGGLGSRIGGDKPLQHLGGQPLLTHSLARLRSPGMALALSGDIAQLDTFGLEVLPDETPEKSGPLAGLLSALRWAESRGLSRVITAPCDSPFLPPDLVSRLEGALSCEAAIAASGGEVHNTIGIWAVSIRGKLEARLQQGKRSVHGFLAQLDHAIVEWETTPLDPFFNINTPLDLFLGESMARRGATPQVLDMRRLKCPLPALKTAKALAKMPKGASLVVFCTDMMAQIDIPHAAAQAGATLLRKKLSGEVLMFEIEQSA